MPALRNSSGSSSQSLGRTLLPGTGRESSSWRAPRSRLCLWEGGPELERGRRGGRGQGADCFLGRQVEEERRTVQGGELASWWPEK